CCCWRWVSRSLPPPILPPTPNAPPPRRRLADCVAAWQSYARCAPASTDLICPHLILPLLFQGSHTRRYSSASPLFLGEGPGVRSLARGEPHPAFGHPPSGPLPLRAPLRASRLTACAAAPYAGRA